MQIKLVILISSAILAVCVARAVPDTRNPNLDYELVNIHNPQISSKNGTGLSPILPPQQQQPKPFEFNTPPPVNPNSKTFAYDPKTQTWTLIKPNDPQPNEDTLVWNQSNDKWLTQTAPRV